MKLAALFLTIAATFSATRAEAQSLVFEGKDGPMKGKHVVLLSGDEEYRSEEALPMLGRLLAERHGAKCTVLFSLAADGTIDPNNQASVGDSAALDSADAIVMALRYRKWLDADMARFAKAIARGVPVVGLRTSTHAFNGLKGEYARFNKFGKNVLGEEWVSHWGRHKSEATRGVIEPAAKDHALLRGVGDIFGDTDVYEAYPPADATILVRGQVLKGMQPADAPADYKKKGRAGEQGVNAPMMPVAWTRTHTNEAGTKNKILCTTLGSATDLASEGLRRLVVNGVYWGLGLDVPAQADVAVVGEFTPTMYGFGGFKKGVKPADHAK